MGTFLWVGAGGAVGSSARYGVNVIIERVFGTPIPLATAVVNIVGCAIIGLLAGLVATGQLALSTQMRAFLFAGIMGGFTTFSSFGLDTLTLVHGDRVGLALGNVAAQLGIGLAAVFVGYAAAVTMK